MTVVRTPDERFRNLPDYDFAPHYHEINDSTLGILRLHYLDEGHAGHRPLLIGPKALWPRKCVIQPTQ